MFFVTLKGERQELKQPHKYAIDWDKKSRSKFQSEIKNLLASLWVADIVFEEFPVLGTRFTLDFYNASYRVAIEVDGDQHVKYNRHFHGKSKLNFIKQLNRDSKKEDFCVLNNIKLVRIYKSDKLDTTNQLENFINHYGER